MEKPKNWQKKSPPQNKHNPYQSVLFQTERIRNRTPQALAEEYSIFLSTLYGRRIESGDVRMQDYAHMTMFDVVDEIRIRTRMLHADTTREIEKFKDKRKKEQEKAIQELLMIS